MKNSLPLLSLHTAAYNRLLRFAGICVFILLFLPSSYAEDPMYDPGDIAALRAIKANNDPNNQLNWTGNDYNSWTGVTWRAIYFEDAIIIRVGLLHLNPLNFTGDLNISSLTALKQLTCGNNQLTSLNVSGCTELVTLDCRNNQLTQLNLSGLTKLAYLRCQNNRLTQLNLSGLTELVDLECQNNQLTQLNFSECTELYRLKCQNNQLTQLDLSELTELVYVECQNNQLTQLDLSGCIILRQLYCFDNQLTKLDLRGCTESTYIECQNNRLTQLDLNEFTKLAYLRCQNNQLSQLNLNGCLGLKDLNCSHNQLSILNVSQCVKLDNLSCSNNRLTDNSLPYFYNLTFSNTNVDITFCFDLRGNIGFTEKAIRELDAHLANINFSQILWNRLPEFNTKLDWSEDFDKKEAPSGLLGVVADGAANVYIKILASEGQDTIRAQKIRIYLLAEDGNLHSEMVGLFENNTISVSDNNPVLITEGSEKYYKYAYHAPIWFSLGSSYINSSKRIVNAKIVITLNNGTDSLELVQPIEIIRPPLLMVHGLDSNPSTFAKMATDFRSRGLYDSRQILQADYASNNTGRFMSNDTIVLDGLNKLFKQLRYMGYAAKKADVVGHSMGGLLSRIYLQSDVYRNDINKLITLNTPHSGSQGANLIMDVDNKIDVDILNVGILYYTGLLANVGLWDQVIGAWVKVSETRIAYYNFVKKGAVKDLCVGSDAITKLNSPSNLNKHIVPCHAIYTWANSADMPKVSDKVSTLILTGANYLLSSNGEKYKSIDDVMNYVFNVDSNDCVVAAESQKGGLSSNHTSLINHQWHSSTENPNVISRINDLLNAPATDNNVFSHSGFAPANIIWKGLADKKVGKVVARPSVLDENEHIGIGKDAKGPEVVSITSISKQDAVSNDVVNITVTGSTAIDRLALYAETISGLIYRDTKEGNTASFSYTIPEGQVGYKKLLAIGYGKNGVAIDTSHVSISTSASLLSVSYSKDTLVLPLFAKQGISNVLGSYSDNVSRDISSLTDIVYSVKGNKAVVENSMLVGKKEGIDTLYITCQGKQSSVPVKVIDFNHYNAADIAALESANIEATDNGVDWQLVNEEMRVVTLDLSNHGLTGSKTIASLSELGTLIIGQNQLTELTLTNVPKLKEVYATFNRLTFKTIYTLMGQGFQILNIIPQSNIPVKVGIKIGVVSLSDYATAHGTLSDFVWTKEEHGEMVTAIQGKDYVQMNTGQFQFLTNGTYRASITNSRVKGAVLTTIPVVITGFPQPEVVTAFPNPVLKRQMLQFDCRVQNIEVANMQGVTVLQYKSLCNAISMANLTAGSYIVTGTTEKGESFSIKIVIQ